MFVHYIVMRCLQTLKGEFDERDEFLESIEVQIKDFQTLGKTLAADRLQKKLDFIKVERLQL